MAAACDSSQSNRARLEAALAGEPVEWPVYAAYDWFIENRAINWPRLVDLGLGRINHAPVVELVQPNVEIAETVSDHPSGHPRRDVRWVTDAGELHEWYLGEWRQEHLVKRPEDYAVLTRAFSDAEAVPRPDVLEASERTLGDNGVTMAQTALRRTAFQTIQIDYAGLERFSLDVGMGCPELFELVEVMDDITLREFEAIAALPVRQIKLWENLTQIETMGPRLYRERLVPVYRAIFDILARSGQRLSMHYDGKLRLIADDVAAMPLDGLDSLTPPPEGDLTVAEARKLWPEKFLWLHPCLAWYDLPDAVLVERIRGMVRDASPARFCLLLSEEVPESWERSVPLILEALRPA